MGNILGRIGTGRTVIAMDAHVDTVGPGALAAWRHDPYRAVVGRGLVRGRGAADQRAALASLLYGVKVIKDLRLFGDFTLWVVGSVQEEECEGLCWRHLVEVEKLRPDCVVLTEPTGLAVSRGQRGRLALEVVLRGVACHGSAPERGRNPVSMLADFVPQLAKLARRLPRHPVLGRGSIAITEVRTTAASSCAVPGECTVRLDRRLVPGETKDGALREVRRALLAAGINSVTVPRYTTPSYTGWRQEQDEYFPAWLLAARHPAVLAAAAAARQALGRAPRVGTWSFSTNGVATMGRYRIPTVGFGPAHERYAHTVDDQVPVAHLARAAAWYALFPRTLAAG